jgi:putative ABC transport system ATP-binding protein
MGNTSLIELNRLTKKFPVGKAYFTALKDIDLVIEAGEFTGVVGPSGSGKTTLLNIIGTLDTPTEGSATVLNQKVSQLSNRQAAKLRNRHLGFIFQTYNLFPVYTVYENVEFALLLQHKSAAERKKAVMEALEWVGLTDKVNSKPAMLSGGESQRVAIARSMVKRPEIVLADEPTANLDSENSHHILQTMKKLNEELKVTFLFATHDEKVMQYLNRKITLKDGRVAEDKITSAT